MKTLTARTIRDLDQVYRIREKVFQEEHGKCMGTDMSGCRLDTISATTNLLFHDVATVRFTTDKAKVMPVDTFFDTTAGKESIKDASFACVSMLAIRKDYTNVRTFRAVVLGCLDLAAMHGTTHILAAAKKDHVYMWTKLGATVLGEPKYVPELQDTIVPMVCAVEDIKTLMEKKR